MKRVLLAGQRINDPRLVLLNGVRREATLFALIEVRECYLEVLGFEASAQNLLQFGWVKESTFQSNHGSPRGREWLTHLHNEGIGHWPWVLIRIQPSETANAGTGFVNGPTRNVHFFGNGAGIASLHCHFQEHSPGSGIKPVKQPNLSRNKRGARVRAVARSDCRLHGSRIGREHPSQDRAFDGDADSPPFRPPGSPAVFASDHASCFV